VVDPRDIQVSRSDSVPASFWERIQFIVTSGKSQKYAVIENFKTTSVAVVRGRIVTSRGRGLSGVRISDEDDLESGFTMSRADGTFDFVVNADGTARVALKFGKSPFPFQTKSFGITPNRVS
jgi:hypothetical protein